MCVCEPDEAVVNVCVCVCMCARGIEDQNTNHSNFPLQTNQDKIHRHTSHMLKWPPLSLVYVSMLTDSMKYICADVKCSMLEQTP